MNSWGTTNAMLYFCKYGKQTHFEYSLFGNTARCLFSNNLNVLYLNFSFPASHRILSNSSRSVDSYVLVDLRTNLDEDWITAHNS